MADKRAELIKKLEALIEDTKWSDIVDLSPKEAKDILALLKEQQAEIEAPKTGVTWGKLKGGEQE